jgi:transposase
MRFFIPPPTTAYYGGIDLHARTMYLVVLDRDGNIRLHRNLPARPDVFLKAVQPFRPDLVVASECVHSWYWLANTCAAEPISFVLGHALGLKAVHGSKTKSDAHDGDTIARLLRGGNLPQAYAYPQERRSLRDLLRTRLRFVRLRARTYGHVHTALRQLNLPPVSNDVKYKSKRGTIADTIADEHVRRSVAADLELLDPLDTTIRHLERDLEVAAQQHYARELAVLQSIPGVGLIISLTVLLEIDTIDRFDSRQQFCSYARLIAPPQESAGKKVGVGCRKQGNAWLKWAFSEAAVLCAQKDERLGAHLQRLTARYGTDKALTILAHKLGRAMYHLLHTKKVFDLDKFLRH